MRLNRLGLKPKVALGFGSLVAIIAAMGMVGFHSAQVNQALAEEMRNDSAMKDAARQMQEAFLTERIGTRDVLMGRDNDSTHLYERGKADLRVAMESLIPLLATQPNRTLYANVQRAADDYSRRNDQVVGIYRSGDAEGAVQMFKGETGWVLANALSGAMHQMMTEFDRQRNDAMTRQRTSDARTKGLMLALALAGLALGLAIAQHTAHTVVRAVREMLAMANMISSNNLAAEDVKVRAMDEMGSAAAGLNRMKNNLREVILSISSAAEEVSGSSRKISATASQAAVGVENQKQQVERIAMAMQQIAATIREVSRHSNAAARSAESAAGSARDGGRTVGDLLERMRGIAHSVDQCAANIEDLGARSTQIDRIAGAIDEIAEQTNLLALNAAIEAARAGEHGRGFAVVAGEVRRLSERTTAATREIALVIQGVQSITFDAVQRMRAGRAAVENGVEVAAQAGASIQRIIREADNVGAMVAQIASAATQQAGATDDVTAGMTQISGLAVETAEGSQLSARACGQLFDLALRLKKAVDCFELGQPAQGAPVAPDGSPDEVQRKVFA